MSRESSDGALSGHTHLEIGLVSKWTYGAGSRPPGAVMGGAVPASLPGSRGLAPARASLPPHPHVAPPQSHVTFPSKSRAEISHFNFARKFLTKNLTLELRIFFIFK